MAEAPGKARLVSVVALGGFDESTVLALAASAASRLDSPLGSALLDSSRERGIQVRAADQRPDVVREGVADSVDGHSVVVGNAALLGDFGISLESFGSLPDRLRQRGEHVLFVAIDGRLAAFFGVAVAPALDTLSADKEDSMQRSATTSNSFPSATTGLPLARATESIELGDGDTFNLRIAPVVKRFGDQVVRMLAYNGSIPGPTLRVKQGSELLVAVANDGDLETTVHWHGLRLDNRYDGTTKTQQPIPVGGQFVYRLSFPDPGVYWYHPHIREDYGQELGLSGAIIVDPTDVDYWSRANREISLTLDDVLIEDGRIAPFERAYPTYTAMGRFGNVLLVNGEPTMSMRAFRDEVVRFYLTNTANTRVFNVALPGAQMKLVGGDSGRYEREQVIETVVIAPSERVVVDVLFSEPGELTLEHRTPNRTYALATIRIAEEQADPSLASSFARLRENGELAAEREQLAPYLAAEPDKTLSLSAEMDMGESASAAGSASAYVCPMHPQVTSARPDRCPQCGMKLVPAQFVGNPAQGEHEHGAHHDHSSARAAFPAGIEWEDDMVEVNRITTPANMRWKLIDRATGAEGSSIDWRFRVGDRVKIRLVNEMDSDHPMHHPLHIHGAGRFLILSRDGVAEDNLVWKDTVLVATGQTVDILLEVTHAGVWMAHCHIAEHHESGMMLTFRVDR